MCEINGFRTVCDDSAVMDNEENLRKLETNFGESAKNSLEYRGEVGGKNDMLKENSHNDEVTKGLGSFTEVNFSDLTTMSDRYSNRCERDLIAKEADDYTYLNGNFVKSSEGRNNVLASDDSSCVVSSEGETDFKFWYHFSLILQLYDAEYK